MPKSTPEKPASRPAPRRQRAPAADKLAQSPSPAGLQRAVERPASAEPAALLGLQRQYGNRATRGLIQAKLVVGAASDRYEQEADRAAQQVLNPPAEASETAIQRQPEPEEDELQARAVPNRPAGPGSFEAGADFETQLAQNQGGGQALPGATQQFMETRLGADFGAVRVHTGGQANQLNRSVQAEAFTHGSDVYFSEGRYAPGSSDGQRLLAHELTHVVQQTGGGETAGAKSTVAAKSKRAGGQVARRIQRRTKFVQLAGRGENYEQEETVQRPDLAGVITGSANGIKALYETRQALQAIADPSDAPALAAAKARLLPNAPNASTRVAGMDLAQTQADISNSYDTAYERARLQDFPIDAQGNLDPVALAARLVEYDRPPVGGVGPNPQDASRVLVSAAGLRRNNATQDPVDTTNSITHFSGKGTEIFVVSPSGELHMASHKVGKFHHSSLLAGGNVALGGEMVVHGGHIVSMTNKSGHYAPTPAHLRQFLHILQKKGVSLGFRIWGQPPAMPAEAAGFTAQTWLASLPAKENYQFESTAALYESYAVQFGHDLVRDHLLVTLHWKADLAGTGMLDQADQPLTQKQVRQALKARFGAARSKVTSKVPDTAMTWINPHAVKDKIEWQ
jgi:hypothetical protein